MDAPRYVTPRDRLEGRQEQIFAERDRKLAVAREKRAAVRRQQRERVEQSRASVKPKAAVKQPIDFTRLRELLPLTEVLRLVGFTATSQHGSQQRGACPLHGTTLGIARCFSVDVSRGLFHCLKCGRSGNSLDLWCAVTRQAPYDAAVDLCQRIGLAVP